MARSAKCKCTEGVPEWVVTYGDMMSLLLTFFILLAAFSELKKDEEYQDVVRAIQEHFGYQGGIGTTPAQDPPTASITQMLDAAHLDSEEFKNPSANQDPGVDGRHTTVTRIREGEVFTIGGLLTFDAGSAVLKQEARDAIRDKLLERIVGKNNKIQIIGHATNHDLPDTSPFDSLTELSFARAIAVQDYLVELGVKPERIRVTASADREPLRTRAYDEESAAPNRRVELIQMEALIKDFEGPEASGSVEVL